MSYQTSFIKAVKMSAPSKERICFTINDVSEGAGIRQTYPDIYTHT